MNQNVTVKKVSLLFLLLFLAAASVWAQVFPVQATTQLSPPYSLYLADYVASGSERLALNVYLADIARPQLDVRFRLRIVGQGITIETKQEYRPAPVSIQGGVPVRLISTDLADYFNVNNLNFQGITRREYEQRGKLPEGVYQFCFEVLEYNRGVKISNTACAIAWLILNDPPIINLPGRDEKLKAQSPQNVLLQWTPRHTGSPNSAFTTEYEVTMVEVWPSTRNPNDAILTSPPILQTTTANTTFIYGPAETPLEPGRRYAFRVKAKSIAGVDELDLFKNNGYSEVYSFIYGDACDLPTGISVSAVSPTKFTVAWQGTFNQTAFRVRYREVGTAAWYDSNVSVPELQITSLKPGTTYEYQVAATCGFFDGQYATSGKVTTMELPEAAYACNNPMQTFDLDPAQLTGSLKVGDVIDAGDFNVKLTKISGSNGVFSGEGVVEVPYFNKAKIRTSFTSISVNKEMRMVNGVMNVTGGGVDIVPQELLDGLDKLEEVLDVVDSALTTIEENLPKDFDPDGFVADTLITVKDGIHSVYKNDDGSVVVVDKSGSTQTLPPGSNYAVKDNAGNGYLIDSKGNIHKTTADVAGKAGSREYKLELNFGPAPLAKHGFDANKYPALARDYEQLKDNYSVAWKAVAVNGNDPVTAILKSTTLDKSKIKFEQGGNAVSAPPFTGQETTLSIAGKTDGDTESLLAIYPAADSTQKDQVLGKLNVATYAEITKSVVIVPVGNVTVPGGLTVDKISAELNKIYGQAVVRWNVSLAERLPHTPPSPFDDGESGLLTNYTADMKAVIKAFGALQDETFYLFLLDNPKSGRGLGYMPRSKQAGFIFLGTHNGDTEAMVRTMAHELGHGAFNLHHTFQEPNITLTQGATENLMDYPAGDKLYKYQWDKLRYKDIVVGLFEDDEEGELAVMTMEAFEEFVEDPNGVQLEAASLPSVICDGYTFLTKKDRLITLSEDIVKNIRKFHMSGRYLIAVTYSDGKVYQVGTTYFTKKLAQPVQIDGKTVTSEVTHAEANLMCSSCVASGLGTTFKASETKEYQQNSAVTLYDIGDAYKIKIASQTTCTIGKPFIIGETADGKFVCDIVSVSDCEGAKGGAGQGATVRNYSKQAIQNVESLQKLLAGLKPAPGNRHFSKAILFVTDEALKKDDPKRYAYVENYKPQGDTVKIWIHHNGQAWTLQSGVTDNANQLMQEYAKNNLKLDINDLISQYKDTEVDKIATALYEFFDWLAKGVEKAKIPESVWNCDKADEYQSIYATVYGWVTAPLKPIRMIVQEQFKQLLQNDPQNAALLQKLQNMEQIELAAICGLWDGLVDVVAGVPQMLKLISGLASSKGWDDMSKMYNQLSTYNNPDTKSVGIMGALKDGITDMFNPQKPCELAHNSSGIVVGIALCFINPAAIEGSFGKVIANFVKIVQRIDAIADKLNPITKIVGATTKMAFQSVKGVVTYTFKSGKLIIKIASRMGEPFAEIDWNRVVVRAQMIDPYGRVFTGPAMIDPSQFQDGILRIKEIIKDEQGKIFSDANGSGLAELTDGSVVVVRTAEMILEETFQLLKSKFPSVSEDILRKVAGKNLPNLSDFLSNPRVIARINATGYADVFLDDLTRTWGRTKVLGGALNEIDETVVDRWKTFMDNVSSKAGYDADGAIKRLDIDYLKRVENPADDFKVSSNKKNAQAMVDTYGCVPCKNSLDGRGVINKNTLKILRDLEDLVINGRRRTLDWKDIYKRAGYPEKQAGEAWEAYFDRLEAAGFNKFQAHHIFPAELFTTSSAFRHYFKYYKKADLLDFNALQNPKNTIMVEWFKHGTGLHTNHTNYTERIQQHLDEFMEGLYEKTPGITEEAVAEELHKKINSLGDKLKGAIVDQGMIDANSLLKQADKHIDDLDFSSIF